MASFPRAATLADAEGIHAIYAPIVSGSIISFELEPPGVEEIRARIGATRARYPWLVSCDGHGAVDGYAYASRHRERAAYQWAVDVAAYVREDSRAKGIARSLYTALFEQLVGLNFCHAFAGIALPNAPSVGFHESMGFELLGIYRKVGFKLGAWHDVGWWQKTLQLPDHPQPPALPKA